MREATGVSGDGPLLSVVVPALNEERRLGLLLSDLARQTREADEVIVVDAALKTALFRSRSVSRAWS